MPMHKYRIPYLTILLFAQIVLLSKGLFSQNEMILYNIQSIPQSNAMNPALIPDCKKNSGLFLSSGAINYHNSSFLLSDLIKPRDNQSQLIDFNSVFDKLHDRNTIQTRGQWEYLSYGERKKNSYFNLTFTTKSFLYSEYSKNFAELAIYGNSVMKGQDKQVGDFWTNFTAYQDLDIPLESTTLLT